MTLQQIREIQQSGSSHQVIEATITLLEEKEIEANETITSKVKKAVKRVTK